MLPVSSPDNSNQEIDNISEIQNDSKSKIIDYEYNKNPYELGKDLFGKRGSEKVNLSKDYKYLLRNL